MPGSPAVRGNVAGLVHGARSPRVVEPVAREIAAALLAAAPYLQDPRYAGAVEALAVTEARLRLVDRYLQTKGLFTRKGRTWQGVDYAYRLERLADGLRSSLGLTPASRARLGRDVAGTGMDLARQWSLQGRQPPAASGAVDGGDAAADTEPGGAGEPDAGAAP